MEGLEQYIDVLVQAPVAVALLVFIYLSNKTLTTFMQETLKTINEIIKK